MREISGEACVGWREDTKLEPEVWAWVLGPRERRAREWREQRVSG